MVNKTNDEEPFLTTQSHAQADPFRLLVEAVKDYAIFMLDSAGNVFSWNTGAEKIKGYKAEEIIGKHISCFYTAEDVAAGKPEQGLKIALEEGRFEEEGLRLKKGGSPFWAIVTITEIHDSLGHHIGFANVTRDITERKREEKQFRESEGRMRSIVDHLIDGIITIDEKGTIGSYNPAAEKIFGYTASEVVGKNVKLLMPDPFHSEHDGYLTNYLRSGEAKIIGIGREVVGLRKDGTTFPLDLAVSAFHLDERRYFTGIVRDISERKRANESLQASEIERNVNVEALRRNEEKFRELTAHLHQVLWMIDVKEDKILYVSPGYEKVWGRSCQSLIDNPHSYIEVVHPLDVKMMQRADTAMYQTGHIDAECRVLRSDGAVCWVWVRGYPIMEQGQIVRLVGVSEDITEKRRLSAERDTLLARLQLHIDRMPLAYVLYDVDFRILDWNSTAERIFGYTKGEMLGVEPPYEKLVPRSYWEEGEEIRRRIRSGDMAVHSIHENLTKDGRTITCQWFNTPLLDDTGQFLGCIFLAQDVTALKSLESQLHQAQKLEAVGQLAGGVAHDFNNLLTIISGYSDIILSTAASNDPLREFVKEISAAGERAASLTRQLLAFSRKTILELKVLDLNEVVRETGKMLRRLIGEDILLNIVLDPTISRVKLDPDQLSQVMMNLAVNARDAMPKGGNLTVETKTVELDQEYARLHSDVQPGQYVLLSVADTGSGMTAEVKGRIFEPFFTTKGVGKGTGLGLAVVLGIVKQNGGNVGVYSELNQGTTFKLYFPAVEEQADTTTSYSGVDAVRGTETVLLVEDEDGVRGLAFMVLQSHGYMVLSARDGKEALRRVAKHQGPIELLVTDVVMPGMGGRELAESLQPRYPQMKVLYTSGYTDDAVVRHGVLQAESAFLQKPYSPKALASKVRQVLDHIVV